MAIISEPGLYFFLKRSDKPAAMPMQMLVSVEILTSIRKTGPALGMEESKAEGRPQAKLSVAPHSPLEASSAMLRAVCFMHQAVGIMIVRTV